MASIHTKEGKSGKKTHYVVVSIHGKHKWIKAGTKQNALILKKQIESLENSKLLEQLGFTTNDIKVNDFFDKYIDYINLHTSPNTFKRYYSIIQTFLSFLKFYHSNIRYLSKITMQVIESYQQKRLTSEELQALVHGEKNGSHKNIRLPKPQTVNYEISILRTSFIWAKERDYISEVPTKKVKKLKVKTKRDPVILSHKESKHFLKTCREMAKENKRYKHYLFVFQFLLNSGLRSGELCNLSWDDIDFKKGTIKVQPKLGWTPKTYAREFFYNDVCLSILKRIKEREGYVFKTIEDKQFTTDILRNALIRIAKKACLSHLTRVHDLRHTYSTYLQMRGVDRATVGEIIGHEDEKTTKIYSHTYEEHMKKAVNLVGVK